MQKLNWKLIGADIASALTMLSVIPYDRDTMSIIGSIIPVTWLPYVVKAGIAATLILRLWNRYQTPALPTSTGTLSSPSGLPPAAAAVSPKNQP